MAGRDQSAAGKSNNLAKGHLLVTHVTNTGSCQPVTGTGWLNQTATIYVKQ